MTAITRYRRAWGLSLLALLLVASFGPWAYERINVPAQYACSAPYVRLVGDYCGQPVSGMNILAALSGALPTLAVGALTGRLDVPNAGRDLATSVRLLLIFLPLASALIWIAPASQPRLRLLHWAAWGLAVVGLLGLLPYALALPAHHIWGLWLYTGLVLAVSGGAVGLLALRRRSGPVT